MRNSDRGFGLLEVVIATGIISLVLGSVLGLLNSTVRKADAAARRTTAMHLAQQSLEEARALRDSAAIDKRNKRWTDNNQFPTGKGVFARNDIQGFRWIFNTGSNDESITLADGVTYTRTVDVLPLPDTYASQIGMSKDELNALGRQVSVVVSWGNGVGESVQASTYLTDWRPGA